MEDIRPEDLKDEHRQISETIGLENLVKMSEVYGGSTVYIPKKENLKKGQIYREIKEQCHIGNVRELAAKYNVSTRTVYNIIEEKRQEHIEERKQEAERRRYKKTGIMKGQITLY